MKPDERERHGWDAAVTLVTAIDRSPPVLWRRRWVMELLNRNSLVELANQLGLLGMEPVRDKFKRFNHLHYARWSLAGRLPSTAPAQPRETGRYTVMVFTSHFDFGWRRYLGSFIETTADGLGLLWGDAPGWISPFEGFGRFEQFVQAQRVEHDHLFAAYPNWSCNDVRAALRRAHDHRSHVLAEAALRDRGVVDGADARRAALDRRLQYCAGGIAPVLGEYAEIAARQRPDPAYPTQGVTCLVPYPRDEETAVRDALGGLPFGPDSPFARVPGTHFARLARIGPDWLARQPEQVEPFASGYLLLTGEVDGDGDAWLRAVAGQPEIRSVLRRCWGFPHDGDVDAFFRRCRIAPTLQYIDYPMTTVADIFAASDALAGVPAP